MHDYHYTSETYRVVRTLAVHTVTVLAITDKVSNTCSLCRCVVHTLTGGRCLMLPLVTLPGWMDVNGLLGTASGPVFKQELETTLLLQATARVVLIK